MLFSLLFLLRLLLFLLLLQSNGVLPNVLEQSSKQHIEIMLLLREEEHTELTFLIHENRSEDLVHIDVILLGVVTPKDSEHWMQYLADDMAGLLQPH